MRQPVDPVEDLDQELEQELDQERQRELDLVYLLGPPRLLRQHGADLAALLENKENNHWQTRHK